MHSYCVILRFRSHCIYVLMINGSTWSESLMRFWLHLHLNLVYSEREKVCLGNEISVMVIISFTCSSWEDSLSLILSSTLRKVTQFQWSPLFYKHIGNGPYLKGPFFFCVESKVVGKSESEKWNLNSSKWNVILYLDHLLKCFYFLWGQQSTLKMTDWVCMVSLGGCLINCHRCLGIVKLLLEIANNDLPKQCLNWNSSH